MELALYMSKNGYSDIHYTELKKRVSKSMANKIFSYYDIEDFDNKIRTCTFLCRDQKGYYTFIHKSFMEYFVAMGVQEAFETTRDVEQMQKIMAGVEIMGDVELLVESLELECPDCESRMEFGSDNGGFVCVDCGTKIWF